LINGVKIKNFQSHKDTKIHFNPEGVNVIIGNSDQGKSAILRSMLWVIRNRPLGIDDIISHWARDKKGKITDEMEVVISTENGNVSRKRTADDNEYRLTVESKTGDEESKLFQAINKEVPADIDKFFKLTDVNIQQQHDSSFLLSSSAADVAKYFNRIVRLDVIDSVLSKAESLRRETNKKIKETESEIKNYEKEIGTYKWLDKAEKYQEKLQNTDERLKIYNDEYIEIFQELVEYGNQKKIIDDVPDIKKANNLIEKIEKIVIDYELLEETEKDINQYKIVNRDRKIYEMIKSGKEVIEKIETIKSEIIQLKNNENDLSTDIKKYSELKKQIDIGFDKQKAIKLITEIELIRPDYDFYQELNIQYEERNRIQYAKLGIAKEIEDLKTQLPDICPTCGAPMLEGRK